MKFGIINSAKFYFSWFMGFNFMKDPIFGISTGMRYHL